MHLLAFLLAACAPTERGSDGPAGLPGPPGVDTLPTGDTGDPADTATAPPPVTDTFAYARPKVDILIVVDNSSSMNGKNKTFAEAVAHAADEWVARGVDFHAGVVDIDANDWLGELEAREDGTRWVTDATEDPAAALTEVIEDVPDFSSDESGRRAAWLALEYAADGGPNEGFLRDDAELDILVHSDEDDMTEEPTHDAFVAYVRALRPDPDTVRFHAISYGTDYASLADELGGVTQDVADTPYDPALDAMTALFHRTNVFPLSAHAAPGTVTVEVAGVPLAAGAFRYEPLRNVVDLDGVPLAEGDEVRVTYVPAGP